MERENLQGRGVWRAGQDLLSTTLRHLKARWGLLAVEGQDVSKQATALALFGAAALFALIVAYIFLALTVSFLIAWLCHAIGGVWVMVMLGATLAHVILAVTFALMAKKQLKAPWFPLSRAELKKDFA